MNTLSPPLLLLLLACALAATSKTDLQVYSAGLDTALASTDKSFEVICDSINDYGNMSFTAMEKVIQDLSRNLTQNTNELKDDSYQMCGTASNSSTNSSAKSVDTADYSDRKRVIAITKKLADSMTRTPKRCREWVKCEEDVQNGLSRASSLTERAKLFVPSTSEAVNKLHEKVWRLYCANEEYSDSNSSPGIKTIYYDEVISRSVELVECMLKIAHSIDFKDFPYDKQISFAQFLIDVSKFAGLNEDEKVVEEDLMTEMKMELLNIKKDRNKEIYGSYSRILIEISKIVHLTPKSTNFRKLTSAFHVLVQATKEYAELSPERDTIQKMIQSIIDEETKLFDLERLDEDS